MFTLEPEIEFDFRSIIADQVPTEKVIRQTRIDGLDALPASKRDLLERLRQLTANLRCLPPPTAADHRGIRKPLVSPVTDRRRCAVHR
jgi:hypothetical protein